MIVLALITCYTILHEPRTSPNLRGIDLAWGASAFGPGFRGRADGLDRLPRGRKRPRAAAFPARRTRKAQLLVGRNIGTKQELRNSPLRGSCTSKALAEAREEQNASRFLKGFAAEAAHPHSLRRKPYVLTPSSLAQICRGGSQLSP